MKSDKIKGWLLTLPGIIVLIVGISSLSLYVQSKYYWKITNRIQTTPLADTLVNYDTLPDMRIARTYKTGTALEIYKQSNPCIKLMSKNHGYLEFAVACGDKYYTDHAVPGDAVIRKLGGGNIYLMIPSTTSDNGRGIFITNEDKSLFSVLNNGKVLMGASNISVDTAGVVTASAYRVKLDKIAYNGINSLQPLSEVEQYYTAHKYLPGIPTIAEMQTNGLDMGEFQLALLRKIEELTLYSFELRKANNEHALTNRKLQEQVQELKHELTLIKKHQ